jgi:thymidylate synthase ThyX
MSITAKIIADSISSGVRITTMELNYHRFIHSEFMTHRMFSRNASSSRAIPVDKMIKQVEDNPAMPIHWGKNQPGMQANEECDNLVRLSWDYYSDCERIGSKEQAWEEAADFAASAARRFSLEGYHKQIVNRLVEPFQYIKVIVTATEWENFFKLRMHPYAQPEMMELARCMKEAMDNSLPVTLSSGEWHLPYVRRECFGVYELKDAIKCSVARCARVSYLNHDNSTPDVAKDIALADILLESGHMSPFEHQATPMPECQYKDREEYDLEWVDGITHQDRLYILWSGNFRGFLQYRQMLCTQH